MMDQIIIPRELSVVLFLLCFAVSVVSAAIFMRSFWARRTAFYRMVYLLLTLGAYGLMEFFDDDSQLVPLWVCVFAVPLLIALYVAARLIRRGRRNTKIGPDSVKECVDRLPIGICCYFNGGQIKLVNDTMSSLCIDLTGETLRDGEWFCEKLKALRIPNEENALLAMTGSGRYYSFRELATELDGRVLNEIIATDVTREYGLTAELKEKERQVADLNNKLKELSEESLKTAVEREVLTAKIRVHDDLGRIILLARRCLNNRCGSGLSLQKTANEVRKQAILMLSESPDEWRRDYGFVFRTAKQLGMNLKVQGKIPQEERSRKLAVSALNCAILNSARHAGADQINVRFDRIRDEASGREYYEMSISDNVNFQVEKVEEKGGLKSLRNEIEAEGGSLIIRVGRGVKLNARIPVC